MTLETRIARFLPSELVAVLRISITELFKRWLYGVIHGHYKTSIDVVKYALA